MIPKKLSAVCLVFVAMLLVCGCSSGQTAANEQSCKTDSDCACGVHKDTGDCFRGNKAFVDVERQCPDFCTGIDGRFRTVCVENKCTGVRASTEP